MYVSKVWPKSDPTTLTPDDTASRTALHPRGGGWMRCSHTNTLDGIPFSTHIREPPRVRTQTATLKGKSDTRRRGYLRTAAIKKMNPLGKKLSSREPHIHSRGQLTGGLTSGTRDRQQWLVMTCCSLVPIIASTHSPQDLADGIKDHSPWGQDRKREQGCAGGPGSSRVTVCGTLNR